MSDAMSVRRVEQAVARRVDRRVVGPLQRGLFNRRPRAHFIHVGKTGGTALKEALAPYALAGRYELVLHTHPFRFNDALPGEKVFCVLRDPLERFVSAFNYRLREGRPHQYAAWTEAEAEAYAAFPSPDALGRALSAEDPARRARAISAMTSIRHVRDSYWRWFDSTEYMSTRPEDLLQILWLPDLAVAFPRLLELLGLPDTITVPGDAARSNRSPDGPAHSLGEDAVANLTLWHGADYGLIDHCAALPSFTGPSYARVSDAPGRADVVVGHP